MSITAFDTVMLIIMLIFIIKVTRTGFVAEFFSKAAVILGGIGAVLFYKQLAPHVEKIIGVETFPGLVSFLVIFLVLYLLVKTIQRIVGSAFESETMKNLDQALGFFLGIVEGLLVVLLIIVLLEIQPWFDSTGFTRGSLLYQVFKPLVFTGTEFIPVLINGN